MAKHELCGDMTDLYNCRNCDENEHWDNACPKKQELYDVVLCKECAYFRVSRNQNDDSIFEYACTNTNNFVCNAFLKDDTGGCIKGKYKDNRKE